jgi:hypothetical protein
MATAEFNKKTTFHQQIGLFKFRNKLVKYYICSIAGYVAEIGML